MPVPYSKKRLDPHKVRQLEDAILIIMSLSDAERTHLYGQNGWKLLIKRYIEEMRGVAIYD